MNTVNSMKFPKEETLTKRLRQELGAKANKASELSRKIQQTESIMEANRLSKELKLVTEDMERIVAMLYHPLAKNKENV